MARGYTRVLRCNLNRKGDNAPMAWIEYVDRPGELRPTKPPTQVPCLLAAALFLQTALPFMLAAMPFMEALLPFLEACHLTFGGAGAAVAVLKDDAARHAAQGRGQCALRCPKLR